MLESALAAASSLTEEPASSAQALEGRMTRGRGSVSGRLASLGRPEGSAADTQAANPSITDAAAKMLSGAGLLSATLLFLLVAATGLSSVLYFGVQLCMMMPSWVGRA